MQKPDTEMIIHKVGGLWDVAGHESGIPFAVGLLLHGVPISLLSSDNQHTGPLNLKFPAFRMMRKHISTPHSLSITCFHSSTD